MSKRHIKFWRYYKEWIETYKYGQVRKVTYNKYDLVFRKLKKCVPDLYLDEITRADIQKLINKYGETHEKPTVMDFLHHIQAPLRDAVYEGWIKRDPTYKVHATSQVEHKATHNKVLEPDEISKLIKVFQSRNNAESKMLDFDLRTGLRYAELLALTPKDVDFHKMTIYINKSWNYKDKKMHFQPCKNKYSNRVITIDWHASTELQQLIQFAKCQDDEPICVKAITEEKKQAGKLVLEHGNKYTRMYNSTLNQELASMCKEANVPRISVHSLRHIHGSMLISAGVSIQSVAKRLGHGNTITTQKTYIHLLDDLAMKDNNIMMTALTRLGD